MAGRMTIVAGLALVLATGMVANAQWTSDPLVNTLVSGGSGDQGVPLVGATGDGGAWVSFFSNTGTGYKPMIQRLDVGGHTMLAGNGLTLADRHNSATFVYDMKIDAAGNAIVAFDDDSTGTTMVTVQKVLPDGTLPWGATGRQIPGTTGVLAPRIAPCADGTYVVAWASSNVLNFQRLDTNGVAIGAAWTVTEAGHYQAISDMVATGNGGEFISMWIRGETTSAISSRKGLKIQKWNGSNAAMWNSGTALDVYTSSQTPLKSIQNGYFPAIATDFTGGAIIAWYDNGGSRNAWLQHVQSAGTFRFPAEGLGMTTNGSTTEYRLSASAGYDAARDEYTVAWQRSNTLQSQFGLGVQRVNAAGDLLWGGTGATVIPMQGFQSSFIQAFPGPGGKSYLTWIQYTGAVTQEIQATQLDDMGMMTWPTPITRMATRVSGKGRLGATKSNGQTMLIGAWADNASGSNDIMAQNINFDGTLGQLVCAADFNSDGVLDFFDYLDFVEMFSWAWDTADFNHDGIIDFFDYLDFVAAFAAGC